MYLHSKTDRSQDRNNGWIRNRILSRYHSNIHGSGRDWRRLLSNRRRSAPCSCPMRRKYPAVAGVHQADDITLQVIDVVGYLLFLYIISMDAVALNFLLMFFGRKVHNE